MSHTIEFAVSFVMQKRLYNFNMKNTFDLAISPRFLSKLKAMCPRGDFSDQIPFDPTVTKDIR